MSELAAADNWDEDFEFSQETGSNAHNRDQTFNSISTRSAVSDDWDAEAALEDLQEGGARTDQRTCQPTLNTTVHLGRISEKSSASSIPPSTKPQETEVWDDDFESASGSSGSHQQPARRVGSHSRASSACIQPTDPARKHWDGEAGPSTRKSTRHNNNIQASDDEGDFGIGLDLDEEQTITGRSHRPQARSSPPPPVPALPQSLFGAGAEPFPRSPTVSTFSGPAPSTAGQSTGNHPSTSYLALADTAGLSHANRSAPQEVPRERRRLRKKSRPRHLHEYNNTFELIDPHDLPSASEPTTSEAERAFTPPNEIVEPSPSNSSASKASSFLSRVGSWGGQKKRQGSTTPAFQVLTAESAEDRTPRKHNSHSDGPRTHQTGGWFSRRHRDEVHPTSSSDASPASPPKATRKASLAQLRASQSQESPTKQNKRKPSRMFGEAKVDNEALPRRSTSSKRPSSSGSASITLNFTALPLLTRGTSRSSKSGSKDDAAQIGILGGSKKVNSASGYQTHRATKTADSVPLSISTELQLRSELSPPIELQPPSPANTSNSEQPSVPENAQHLTAHTTPGRAASIQAASLGRNSPQVVGSTNQSAMRRNSLGDLKIPARISQAQNGLKRDLGLVREFAAKVELLKGLQTTYRNLLKEVQTTLDSLPPSRGPSSFVNLSRPPSRARSNTNPVVPQSTHAELSLAAQELHNKYRVPWECAELLIEMGGGTPIPSTDPLPSTRSVPSTTDHSFLTSPKSRERAITLSGNQAKPPDLPLDASSALWRASTGRNDLSQRQLVLLRDMLHQADVDNLPIPEGTVANREWRWGDAMASKATILSEESTKVSTTQKRKSRMGFISLRDMLKALRQMNSKPSALSDSSSPNSSENGLPHRRASRLVKKKKKSGKGQTSGRPTSNLDVVAVQTDHMTGHRPSPRRPSLANLFRMGQKKMSVTDASKHADDIALHPPRISQESTEEEDWDHIDSASDPEPVALVAKEDVPTITGMKGRSPYLQARRSQTPSTRHPSASRSSIFGVTSSPFNSIARFTTTEDIPVGARSSKSFLNGRKRSSMPGTTREVPPPNSSTVRSAPATAVETNPTASQIKLAMTPDNIKPLLESACEVQGQLEECVEALQSLLERSTKAS